MSPALDARGRWSNWAGTASGTPARVAVPRSPAEVARLVVEAGAAGDRVRMVGAGHSFTDVAVTDGLLMRPDGLVGVLEVDREAMTVTVLSGTPLHVLNATLAQLGLSLHNMGDIDRQSVAGAISTGTHGTGGRWASLSAQVCGVEVVTADGTLNRVGPDRDSALFHAARLGLGAVGVLTAVTFLVEPLFTLEATEKPMPWDTAVAGYDDLLAANHHVDMYWFPHTDRMLVKRNNRTVDEPSPLSRTREVLEDRLLSNTVFGWVNALGNTVPAAVPRLSRLSARALSARTYSDVAHRVFTAPRDVVFREMEYAVPREAGMGALREARDLIERSGWRISFPVEVRSAPADDVWLSTAHGRESVYLAFHVNAGTDHHAYFTGVEQVMLAHDGRPHWGKLHSRTAEDLAPAYPRFEDFLDVRDRVDPDRVFVNDHTRRVLGP
jgi:L-gulono-1,4-lactone dehydrogenase